MSEYVNTEAIDLHALKKGDTILTRGLDGDERRFVVTDVRQNKDGTVSLDVQDPNWPPFPEYLAAPTQDPTP